MAPLLLLSAGAALRFLYLATPILDADMSMWGVLAMDILEGRPHFFFAGELFGGALEAWLAAPLFWLAGPSRQALCLIPSLFSLALAWMVWRLASRELGRPAALAATAWVSLASWFLAWYGSLPLGAYIEVPFFTVVCFGLTLVLSGTSRENRAGSETRAALWLGLLWGLGLWTHLLMLPAIAACGVYLLVFSPRIVFSRHILWTVLGFLAGGLPLLLISLPAGLFDPSVLAAGRPFRLATAWQHLWAEGLPQVLGLRLPAITDAAWSWWRAVLWCFYGVLALAPLAKPRTRTSQVPRPRGGLLTLAWLYVLVYLAAWLLSGVYNKHTWRHLTPLFAGLPFIFGAGVCSLARRSRVLALTAACLALGFNLWGSLGQAPLLSSDARQAYEGRLQANKKLFAWLRNQGTRHAYAQGFWDALPLTLDAAGQITFADQIENHLPRLTRQADADNLPALVAKSRATDMENTMRAAGVAYSRKDLADYRVFHGFRRSLPDLEEVNPKPWSSRQGGASEAWDRDLATAWESPPPQRPGQALEIDLGAVEQGLCLVALMPGSYQDAATGLELALSQDGQQWETVAGQGGNAFAPLFWSLDRPLVRFAPARQQLAFAPRPARFLRLTQTGNAANLWWSVAELFLYRSAGTAAPSPSPRDLAEAAREASPQGPIFAPPEALALLPSGVAGFHDPQLPRRDSFPLDKLRIPLKPETVLCLPTVNWPASLELLRGRLASPPQVRQLGDQVVVTGLKAVPESALVIPPPAGARLVSANNPQATRLALDGSPASRWDTAHNQEPGQELTLDLGLKLEVCGLVLDPGPWPADKPRGLRVLVSPDGVTWNEPTGLSLEDGGLVWGGDRVLAGGGPLKVRFTTQPLRQVRLVQTGAHPRRFWSVAEMRLFVPLD